MCRAANSPATIKPVTRLEQGDASNSSRLECDLHAGTHVDAPWHYNSTVQGKKAATIDELPLEWFFGDGVKLDMTRKAEGDPVTVEDVTAELARIKYTIKPMDIVLVCTGRDAFYGAPDYIFKGCGVTAEATKWLYDRGVRVMGIDGWGWDMPLNLQAQKAMEKNEPGIFWAAHQADLPYSHMERLVNLGQLPPAGFTVACFPLKIKGSWVVIISPRGRRRPGRCRRLYNRRLWRRGIVPAP